MAIATIDAVIADVMLMTELDWLLPLYVRAGVPSRSVDADRHEQSGDQKEDGAKDRGSRQIVCAVSKYLRHRRRILQVAQTLVCDLVDNHRLKSVPLTKRPSRKLRTVLLVVRLL